MISKFHFLFLHNKRQINLLLSLLFSEAAYSRMLSVQWSHVRHLLNLNGPCILLFSGLFVINGILATYKATIGTESKKTDCLFVG